MMNFVDGKFSENIKPTIGADFAKKVIEDYNMTLQIWDTAGQEKYRSLNRAFFRGTDTLALCFDLSNRSSFDSLDQHREDFLNHQTNENLLIVLIGTKSDLDDRKVS